MAQITDTELLTKVKDGLGIAGNYQDATLQVYIDEVKDFMKEAGVLDDVLNDSKAIGCIIRGVVDLWNYGSGGAAFSEHFKMRVVQLSVKG